MLQIKRINDATGYVSFKLQIESQRCLIQNCHAKPSAKLVHILLQVPEVMLKLYMEQRRNEDESEEESRHINAGCINAV